MSLNENKKYTKHKYHQWKEGKAITMAMNCMTSQSHEFIMSKKTQQIINSELFRNCNCISLMCFVRLNVSFWNYRIVELLDTEFFLFVFLEVETVSYWESLVVPFMSFLLRCLIHKLGEFTNPVLLNYFQCVLVTKTGDEKVRFIRTFNENRPF